jgi:hypothetical protein
MEVEVCKTLDIWIESLNDRYLALPAVVGEDKSDCFKHSVQILVALISGWWKHSLYGWHRNVNQHVAQAIPVFSSTIFDVPKETCNEISDAIFKLWWGDDDDHKRMHRRAR